MRVSAAHMLALQDGDVPNDVVVVLDFLGGARPISTIDAHMMVSMHMLDDEIDGALRRAAELFATGRVHSLRFVCGGKHEFTAHSMQEFQEGLLFWHNGWLYEGTEADA